MPVSVVPDDSEQFGRLFELKQRLACCHITSRGTAKATVRPEPMRAIVQSGASKSTTSVAQVGKP